MSPPRRRLATTARWAVWPAALAVTGLVVAQSSYSAFSASTSNASNNWTLGTVSITDDDSGTALFTATNLKPGSSGSRCIAVTSTGTLPSTVKLYGTGAASTKSLATYITLTVTQGSGATFGSCGSFSPLGSGSSVFSGTLDTFQGSNTAFSSGLGSWAPTGGSDTRSFQFAYSVSASTPDSVQGGTASVGFTWEAQNS